MVYDLSCVAKKEKGEIMLSLEMMDDLEDNPLLVWSSEFLSEMPLMKFLKWLDKMGWQPLNKSFYVIDGEERKIIMPSKDKTWENPMRWEHNINLLANYYNKERFDILMEILK
jgi:hypothetical protein